MMAPSPIRLAILEADLPIGDTLKKYGSYGGVFTSLFHKACDASQIPRDRLHITGWDVINSENAPEGQEEDMGGEWNCKRTKGYPALEEVDAVLITGSRMWVAYPSDSYTSCSALEAMLYVFRGQPAGTEGGGTLADHQHCVIRL